VATNPSHKTGDCLQFVANRLMSSNLGIMAQENNIACKVHVSGELDM